MDEADDIGLRFFLVAQLMRMPYGWNCVIEGDKARRAWKPTGDHDRSPESIFRAAALAVGGNRPETSYTTDERIERDLDGSFKWSVDPMTGDYRFRRRDDACPKCKGRMQIRKREAVGLPVNLKADLAPAAMAFTESWEDCDMHGSGQEDYCLV